MSVPLRYSAVWIGVLYVIVTGAEIAVARTLGAAPELTAGVVVALGILLGPVAAVGAVAGHVVSELLLGTLTAYSSVELVAQVVLGAGPALLYGQFGRLSGNPDPDRSSVRDLLEFGLMGCTVATVVAVVTAGGAIGFGRSTFSLVAVDVLMELAGSILIVGGLITLVAGWTSDADLGQTLIAASDQSSDARSGSPTAGVWILAVSILWLGLGFVTDITFQSVDIENPQLLVNNLGGWIRPIADLAGHGGVYVQSVLAVVLGGACVALFYRASTTCDLIADEDRRRGDRRWN